MNRGKVKVKVGLSWREYERNEYGHRLHVFYPWHKNG